MSSQQGRPAYTDFTDYEASRTAQAAVFARQILATCQPWLDRPIGDVDVLDVGSGFGATAAELARKCRSVVGIEPMAELHASATRLQTGAGLPGLSFRNQGIEDLVEAERYDLIVLDNVYEHLPNQRCALEAITRALRPGGVLFLLAPNRLWPIEVHYKLPFLSWLPLPLANRYLRYSGRGHDYTDASYAPTRRSLARELNQHTELSWQFVLPGDPSATKAGTPVHYRAGMWALQRWPAMWAVSKAFLVVARKVR